MQKEIFVLFIHQKAFNSKRINRNRNLHKYAHMIQFVQSLQKQKNLKNELFNKN
jgi:hypothetical protein